MRREDVPLLVARVLDRPARWAPSESLAAGDYDGRERTLQVFNADAKDQRRLLGELDPLLGLLEHASGGPLIVIFHSTAQSARYAEFVQSFAMDPPPRAVTTTAVAPLRENCVDEASDAGPHRRAA